MKIGVKILPKNDVLDSQGRAVERSLRQQDREDFRSLKTCRVGKYVQLDFEDCDKDLAFEKAKGLAEFVLCNSLIEDFELEVIEG